MYLLIEDASKQYSSSDQTLCPARHLGETEKNKLVLVAIRHESGTEISRYFHVNRKCVTLNLIVIKK